MAQVLACLGRFDHPADMGADACQTEKPTHAFLSQFYACLIGDLSHIGASGTGENQFRLVRISISHPFRSPCLLLLRRKKVLIHSLISSIWGPFRNLDHAIHD
jgi:hypothetical protein